MPPKQLTGVTLCYQDGTRIEGIAELEMITDFIEEHQEYVRVVRCKDCKHYWKNTEDEEVAVCLASPKDDAYCSEGESREDRNLQ